MAFFERWYIPDFNGFYWYWGLEEAQPEVSESGTGRTFDWKVELYRIDAEMNRTQVAYQFGKRSFLQKKNPYDNYDFGVGSWMVQKNFVVAPAGATEGSRALEIWLMDVWPTLVNERFDQTELKPLRNQGGREPPYSGNIPR